MSYNQTTGTTGETPRQVLGAYSIKAIGVGIASSSTSATDSIPLTSTGAQANKCMITSNVLAHIKVGNGEEATATASLAIISATISAAGTGYVQGNTISLAGGTFATRAIVTVVTTKLVGLSENAAGSGYNLGDQVTLAGGAGATPATVEISGASLIDLAVDSVGSDYQATDTIVLAGGTASTPAEITVSATKLLSADYSNAGIDYTPADVIVLAGGTASTKAELTVLTTQLTDIEVNAAGADYEEGDTVTLAGGTASDKAVVEVHFNSGGFSLLSFSGSSTELSVPGAETTVGEILPVGQGATYTTAATIQVDTVQFVHVNVPQGGLLYQIGDEVYLATGTGTPATFVVSNIGAGGSINDCTVSNYGNYTVKPTPASGVHYDTTTNGSGTGAQSDLLETWIGARNVSFVSGGSAYASEYSTLDSFADTNGKAKITLTGLTYEASAPEITFDIINPGSYTVNSATFTQFSTSGIGTGMTFKNGSFGVNTFSVSEPGAYTANTSTFTQFSTDGDGTGAAFVSPVFGIESFTITEPGMYSVTSATFTQASTSGSGTGATFEDADYAGAGLTIINAGSYTTNTATFTQASTTGSGTGKTFNNAVWGVNTLSVSTPGSYSVIPANAVAQSATSGDGTGATITATWGLGAFAITFGGTGYTEAPDIVLTGGGGSGGSATAVLTNGVITSITVVPGTDYTSVPSVFIEPPSIATVDDLMLGAGESIVVDTSGLAVIAVMSASSGIVQISPLEN